jgi:hypothetical protein
VDRQAGLNLLYSSRRARFAGADGRHHKRLAHRRLAECLKDYAIAGAVEPLENNRHLIPRSEFAIVAGSEPSTSAGVGIFAWPCEASRRKEQQRSYYDA